MSTPIIASTILNVLMNTLSSASLPTLLAELEGKNLCEPEDLDTEVTAAICSLQVQELITSELLGTSKLPEHDTMYKLTEVGMFRVVG